MFFSDGLSPFDFFRLGCVFPAYCSERKNGVGVISGSTFFFHFWPNHYSSFGCVFPVYFSARSLGFGVGVISGSPILQVFQSPAHFQEVRQV